MGSWTTRGPLLRSTCTAEREESAPHDAVVAHTAYCTLGSDNTCTAAYQGDEKCNANTCNDHSTTCTACRMQGCPQPAAYCRPAGQAGRQAASQPGSRLTSKTPAS